MILSRIDRRYVEFEVAGALPDGTAAPLTAVDVALLAPRATPTAATVWTPADYTDGVASVLLAGPEAATDATALVVPAEGCDLWFRVLDEPEVLTAHVERVTVS